MYNPANLNECERERLEAATASYRGLPKSRRWADRTMLVIGGIASLSSLPQVIKIFETQTVEGLSLSTQIIALGAVVAWFTYGIYIKNRPLVITTAITIIILVIVVVQVFVYG